jgi:hypothetical protein
MAAEDELPMQGTYLNALSDLATLARNGLAKARATEDPAKRDQLECAVIDALTTIEEELNALNEFDTTMRDAIAVARKLLS